MPFFTFLVILTVASLIACTKNGTAGGGNVTTHTALDSFYLTGLKWWYVGDSVTRGDPSDIDTIEYNSNGYISTAIAQRYFGGRDSMRYDFDYTAEGRPSHIRKTWLSASTSTYYDYNFEYDEANKLKTFTVTPTPALAYYPLKEYFTYDSKGHIRASKRYDFRGLLLDSAEYYRDAAGTALDSIMVFSYRYDELWNATIALRSSFIFDNSQIVPAGILAYTNIINNSGYILTIPARNDGWDLSVGGNLMGEVMYIFQFYNPDIFIMKNCRYAGVYFNQPAITKQYNWYTSFYENGLLRAFKYDVDKYEGYSGSIELMYSRK